MADRRVFLKTFRGADALKDNTLGLTPAQKYVLLQIDGSRDVEAILEATADLGEFRGVFQELEAKGLLTAFSVGSAEVERAVQRPVPRAAPQAPVARPPGAAPSAGAAARAPSPEDVRLLDPLAPANETLRQAAAKAVYQALGPEADRFVLKLEGAKRNEDLLRQMTHCLEVIEGMGRPGGALARLVEENRPLSAAAGETAVPAFTAVTPRSATGPVDPSAPADKDLREAGNIALYAVLGAEAEPFVARLSRAKTNEELLLHLTLDAEMAESRGRSAGALRRLLADPRFQGQSPGRAPAPKSGPVEPAKESRWSLGRLFHKDTAPDPTAMSAPPAGKAVREPAPLRSLAPTAPVDPAVRQRAIDALYTSLGPDADRYVLRVEKAKTNAELLQQLSHDLDVIEGMGRPIDALQVVLDGPRPARTAPAAAPAPRPAPSSTPPPTQSPAARRPVPAPAPAAAGLAEVKENISGIVKIGFAADGELFQLHLDRAGTVQELTAAAERIRSLLQRIGREELAEAVSKELAKLPEG